MPVPSTIPHPLLRRPGSSQGKRISAGLVSQLDSDLIDNRSLADLLDYIHHYARQVVFPENKIDETGAAYVEPSNWLPFLEESLPFRLMRFGKIDFDRLEGDFAAILAAITEKPDPNTLALLLDFCVFELITPIDQLQMAVGQSDFALTPYLKTAIQGSLSPPLQRFIQLSNTAGIYFCLERRPFAGFTDEPWRIPIEKIYSSDKSITAIPGGREGAVLWLKDELTDSMFEMLRSLRQMAGEALNHLQASIEVFQGRHEPHVGLLFAFLRLFGFFQGDLNRLTRKHLDFFYQQILQLEPKELMRDKAHLIFQVAKHLDSYLVKEGTVFKDGKDAKNLDVLFGLDEEVVIDKAAVKELKTLYLSKTETCRAPAMGENDDTAPSQNKGAVDHLSVIEDVYVALVANSADGKGEPFKDDQSKNWATLGAKKSKFIAPGKDTPESHPFGRIGLVLASPALWLNEGNRDVMITIKCDAGANTDIFSNCFAENIDAFTNKQFYTISEQTVIRIDNLLSLRARAFLQDKLDKDLVLTHEELADSKSFTEDEAKILERLLETTDSGKTYVLKEMPFASLVRYFNVLRLQQDPYRIRFDVEAFLQSTDPVTCQPLVKEGVREDIRRLLDTETKRVDWFTLQFSGEKGWFEPKTKPKSTNQTFLLPSSSSVVSLNFASSASTKTVAITFHAFLGPDEPKVAFYDENAVKEYFKLDRPLPMVKIELNPDIQLACENHCGPEQCCLRIPDNRDPVMMALYQFFRDLTITNVHIEVLVCGMRNLIVQNENSLQDVNSPILPFGPRPKIGSEFYIGNKELFGKNWQTFWIYTDWKDKPSDLGIYYDDYGPVAHEDLPIRKIQNQHFKFSSAVLDHHNWIDHRDGKLASAKYLFSDDRVTPNPCDRKHEQDSAFHHEFQRTDFQHLDEPKSLTSDNLGPLTVNSEMGFCRITLRGVGFQHDTFPFVLASKMFKLAGKLDMISADSILKSVNEAIRLRDALQNRFGQLDSQLTNLGDIVREDASNIPKLSQFLDRVKGFLQPPPQMPDPTEVTGALDLLDGDIATLTKTLATNNAQLETILGEIQLLMTKTADPATSLDDSGVNELLASLEAELLKLKGLLGSIADQTLPKEPYAPLIKSLEMDYRAIADSDDYEDIELIHLYPFANSSRTEHLELGPTLLPTFSDEGTLFVGLDNLRPGGSLQLLFQFAEATADSESKRAEINWHYLTGNRWQPLRRGFEIVSDDTQQMTRSGIVKIALPRDITNVGNTLMPATQDGKHLYWLKVSAPDSTAAVAELLAVHAQAAAATYQPLPDSDARRVGKALAPMSIGKSLEPDFNIKKVEQPYESFGGRLAEEGGHFYTRVSEHLRHKGRSVDVFDVEHLVLEAFPQLYKCKCISHTMGLSANDYRRDLEVAPGYITVAVVPDLGKLKAGEVLEPKAPVTMLKDIKTYLCERASTFARIRVMNPRYEKIHVDVKVRLKRGRDESYYTAQLKTDLTHFLAPWYLGDSEKISFGQHVVYSDVVSFIENLDYIEFIADLRLIDSEGVKRKEIVPLTARSILTGGRVCIDLDREDCGEPAPPPPGREKPTATISAPDSLPCGTGRPFGLAIRKALSQQ